MSLLSAFAFFVLGVIAGIIGFLRWWKTWLNKPEHAQKYLNEVYKMSHPHTLQVSRTDPTPVCPCCGFVGKEAS